MCNWQGQKVVIIGAARQGQALARFLAGRGAQVVLTDKRSIAELTEARQSLEDLGNAVEWVCGSHPFTLLDHADCVCPSGGVPLTLPLVGEALHQGHTALERLANLSGDRPLQSRGYYWIGRQNHHYHAGWTDGC